MASYTPTVWVNGATNALNALNLNHLEGGVSGNATDIGTLTSLTTTLKTNLVAAINEVNAKTTEVSDDATPVLGGNLDTGGHLIHHGTIVDNGSSGTAKNIDWGSGAIQKVSITADGADITFSNPPGSATVVLQASYSGAYSIDWDTDIRWPGGVQPTESGSGKTDIFMFIWNGTYYFGGYLLNYTL